MDSKIRKALKMLALVQRPSGNQHQDEVASRTLHEYITRHGIDMDILNGYLMVKHNVKCENAYMAELFLMVSLSLAEQRDIVKMVRVRTNGTDEYYYEGPNNLYEDSLVAYSKYARKYQITRDDVKRKLEESKNDATNHTGHRIVSIGGSIYISTGRIIGNIMPEEVKYSEQAFYNAFIAKYELIPRCVIEQIIKQQQQQQQSDKDPNLGKDINNMAQMFVRESLNDQIDENSQNIQ